MMDPATEDLQPHSDKLINKVQSAVSDRLNRPEEAYHLARNAASMWTYDEIESVMEIESDVFHEQIEEMHDQDPASAKTYYQQYQARMDGYKRVQSKEDAKFNPAPHKYAITLNRAAELLVNDYKEAGKTQKQIGRVNISVQKFLRFIERSDVPLTGITKRHVKKYIRYSAQKTFHLIRLVLNLAY